MKILYQDILNVLSETPSKEKLSSKLFQIGHEHELDGDIFDFEFTPNRGDCLSLLGLSRDLNPFFGKSKSFDVYNQDIPVLALDFVNLSPEECPKITFLEIEIEEEISEYEPYLENYFSLLGNKKTNFFTDISNYISYEQGQPTHCFESNSINNKLIFENKICEESFKTLLDSEIKLVGKNCVFVMNNEIISLAGVVGGKSTACSKHTKKVLVECAYFDPESIIGKSIKYNITSDAAHKFERGVDIECHESVLRRFIWIVNQHAKIKDVKIKSYESNKFKSTYLPVEIDKINNILGTSIGEDEYLKYLTDLGFLVEEKIKVPSFRNDISSQNDLAEEVARLIGYDNIQNSYLNIKKNTFIAKEKMNIFKLESYLSKSGFSEVINFPFTNNENAKSISIDNPLDINKKHLRLSLKESLIENLLYNERRQKESIKLFEISDLYSTNNKLDQKKSIGIIASGRVGFNYLDFSKKLDKKHLDELLNSSNKDSIFEIQEISRDNLKTKKKDKIFYTEIELSKIPDAFFSNIEFKKNKFNFIKYKSISEYPMSIRDFSFKIAKISEYENVLELIENLEHKYLKESFIFDFFINKKLNEVKLGLRLIFQSTEKTLLDEDINSSAMKLLMPIIEIDGVSVPGLEFN